MPLTSLTYEILLSLADDARHGYGIIKEIESRAVPPPTTGALYLAIQRLEGDGMIEQAPEARAADEDRRRRYYRLTARGRRAAEAESRRLARLVSAARRKRLLADVLEEAP